MSSNLDKQFIDQIRRLVGQEAGNPFQLSPLSASHTCEEFMKGCEQANPQHRPVFLSLIMQGFGAHVIKTVMQERKDSAAGIKIRYLAFNSPTVAPTTLEDFKEATVSIVTAACRYICTEQKNTVELRSPPKDSPDAYILFSLEKNWDPKKPQKIYPVSIATGMKGPPR